MVYSAVLIKKNNPINYLDKINFLNPITVLNCMWRYKILKKGKIK